MAVSPKLARLDAPRVPSVPKGIAIPSLEIVSQPVKLDFAANPNHYQLNGRAGKPKPGKRAPGADLSSRPVLGLSLQCETIQLLDPDFEE